MSVAGWLMIHALFVAAGGGLLCALGMVRLDPRGLLWALGPSYLAGTAMIVLPLIVLGVIGVTVSLLTVLIVGLLEAAGLITFAVLRGDWGRATVRAVIGELRAERWVVGILGAGLVLYLLFAGAALTDAPISWDAAHMWELKSLAIYHYDGLPSQVFTNVPALAAYHMDYPLMQPMFEATIYHGLGHEAVQFVHVELWGLFAAALWTAAWLLAPGRRALTWLPVIALIGIAGGPQNSPTLGNADLTAGLFVGVGALALGLWLEKRQDPHLILGALFLAAGANSKKEGLVFAFAVAVAIVGVLVALRAWRALGRLAAAGAAGLVFVVPWLLYVKANNLPSGDTTPLSQILKGDYLSSRVDRLGPSLDSLMGWLVNSIWAYAAPALLAVAILCLVVRFARPVAAYYVAAVTLMLLALLWMYWTGNFADLPSWLQLTGQRVVGTLAIVSAFGVAHLASSLLLRDRAADGAKAADADASPAVADWLAVSDPEPAGTSQASRAQSPTS